MEILGIIGIIILIGILFVFGGLLGWVFNALGFVFDFLFEGCGSCLRVVVWIILIFLLLVVLFA